MLRYWFIVPMLFFVSLVLAADTLPTFDNYKVTEIWTAKPAKPVLRSPADRMFRTHIREQAKQGPNFAGHFTIVEWGCGTMCTSFVVMNAKNGSIYSPKEVQYGISISYRSDSNLLIIDSTDKIKEIFGKNVDLATCKTYTEGTRYYRWDGNKFRHIAFVLCSQIVSH
jgi:hypothetical protein